jgi:hypothetical protein
MYFELRKELMGILAKHELPMHMRSPLLVDLETVFLKFAVQEMSAGLRGAGSCGVGVREHRRYGRSPEGVIVAPLAAVSSPSDDVVGCPERE